jgi:hypothetical protein
MFIKSTKDSKNSILHQINNQMIKVNMNRMSKKGFKKGKNNKILRNSKFSKWKDRNKR